jgi:hypothetical protein
MNFIGSQCFFQVSSDYLIEKGRACAQLYAHGKLENQRSCCLQAEIYLFSLPWIFNERQVEKFSIMLTGMTERPQKPNHHIHQTRSTRDLNLLASVPPV